MFLHDVVQLLDAYVPFINFGSKVELSINLQHSPPIRVCLIGHFWEVLGMVTALVVFR